MKKTMMMLALLVSMTAVASVDVYQFKTTINYPKIGRVAFERASTPVTGTLTVETDDTGTNSTVSLSVLLKKTNETFVLVPEDPLAYAVFGKKGADTATTIKFVNEDQTSGLTELTFYGWGTLKTKKTGGCTPCGDTTTICTKVTKLTGVVGGKYICPCGGTFTEWDGSCYIGDDEVDDMTVFGKSATITLKTVDGKKW